MVMKKLVKNNAKSLSLGAAYDLVLADLLASLKKIKDQGGIQLGDLGMIYKKKTLFKSALHRKTYLYYQVSFKASPWLKQELNKAL